MQATKRAGRWVIPAAAIADKPVKAQRKERQAQGLRATVDAVFDAPSASENRWSVTSLRAFQQGLAITRALRERAPASQDRTPTAMERCLKALTRGAHEYHRSRKQAHYRAARAAACDAVTNLLIAGDQTSVELATRIEDEVLRSVAGLLNRSERR